MSEIPSFEERQDALEETLKLHLTDEFLETLVRAAKTYGWLGDHVETCQFVGWVFNVAGRKAGPNLSVLNDK